MWESKKPTEEVLTQFHAFAVVAVEAALVLAGAVVVAVAQDECDDRVVQDAGQDFSSYLDNFDIYVRTFCA